MKKIKWKLPFKNMQYLESLTEDLQDNPNIILLTGIQDKKNNIDKVNIILKDTGEDMEDIILNIGTIIGKHEAQYEAKLCKNHHKRSYLEEEIAVDEEQENEGAPKGEDFIPKKIVEKKESIKEIISEVIKEIVAIAPKVSKAKDSKFMTELRIILNNFKK